MDGNCQGPGNSAQRLPPIRPSSTQPLLSWSWIVLLGQENLTGSTLPWWTNISWPAVAEHRPGEKGFIKTDGPHGVIIITKKGVLGVRDGGQGTAEALPNPFNQKAILGCSTQQPVLYQTILLASMVGVLGVLGEMGCICSSHPCLGSRWEESGDFCTVLPITVCVCVCN